MNTDKKPMTDEEATVLHWFILECMKAIVFGEDTTVKEVEIKKAS